MEWISQYLLSVTAAAAVCGIVNTLLGKSRRFSALGKLLAGLCLSLTVIRPFLHMDLTGLAAYSGSIPADASQLIASAQLLAEEERAGIIKSRAEAYILDKAASMGAEITVEVALQKSSLLQPCGVTIAGSISPYAKARLSQMMETDLAIPKEAQQWLG